MRCFSSQREFPLPNIGGLLQTVRAEALPREMGLVTFCNGEEQGWLMEGVRLPLRHQLMHLIPQQRQLYGASLQ